jgi:2-methylisocitrate lyase-like PEP mutase family enzyme
MTEPYVDRAHAIRLKFRALLERDDVAIMPGGFSPLYAMAAERAGFESFFVAGSQMSAYLLGVPDAGMLGLRDIVDHARHCAARADIPIFLDCDTGFGNATNVYFTTQEVIRAGVAGMQIEDQESPKKSGTSAGRKCIPVNEAVGKIRAAVAARDELDPAFVVCARCDAIGAEGETFDDALARCRAYVDDGGADLVWLNSVESLADLKRFCAAMKAPVLTIWGGPQPEPSFDEYRATGVKIVLYPVIAASAGMQAAWQTLNDLRQRGETGLRDWRASIHAGRYPAIDLKTLTNDKLIRSLEERFVPADRQRDYDSTFGHAPHSEKTESK